MRAHAALTVEAVDGRVRARALRSAPPLTLRVLPPAGAEEVTAYLVGSTAGPLGGDDLRLDVTVGDRASLVLRSVAATLAHPGPGGGPSTMGTVLDVGRGATLRWLPEPTIAVRGCDHRARTRIRLRAGATLVWRDEVVLGRHGEAPGSILQRLAVDVCGRPLLRSDVALGPRWPASLGPAGAGEGCRAVGTLLVAGPTAAFVRRAWAAGGPGGVPAAGVAGAGAVRAAVLDLDGPGVVLGAVAARAGALAAVLDAALAAVDAAGGVTRNGTPTDESRALG